MIFEIYILLGLLILNVFIYYFNGIWVSPLLGIVNRWLRWITFSFGLGFLTTQFEWISRPFWLVSIMAFMLWYLVESLFIWFFVSAISYSNIPLYPRYKINAEGDEWPVRKKFIIIRDWLRKHQFQKLASAKATIDDSLVIRSTIYLNATATTKLQVLFVPLKRRTVSVFYVFLSKTQRGVYFQTDNLFLAYGGFYPDDWQVFRKPLVTSIKKLMQIHDQRLKNNELEVWTDQQPVDTINHEQAKLEQANYQYGFLNPYPFHEENGRISYQGKYRMWKEIWLLNYLGRTVDY